MSMGVDVLHLVEGLGLDVEVLPLDLLQLLRHLLNGDLLRLDLRLHLPHLLVQVLNQPFVLVYQNLVLIALRLHVAELVLSLLNHLLQVLLELLLLVLQQDFNVVEYCFSRGVLLDSGDVLVQVENLSFEVLGQTLHRFDVRGNPYLDYLEVFVHLLQLYLPLLALLQPLLKDSGVRLEFLNHLLYVSNGHFRLLALLSHLDLSVRNRSQEFVDDFPDPRLEVEPVQLALRGQKWLVHVAVALAGHVRVHLLNLRVVGVVVHNCGRGVQEETGGGGFEERRFLPRLGRERSIGRVVGFLHLLQLHSIFLF